MKKNEFNFRRDFCFGLIVEFTSATVQSISHRAVLIILTGFLLFGSVKAIAGEVIRIKRNKESKQDHLKDDPFIENWNFFARLDESQGKLTRTAEKAEKHSDFKAATLNATKALLSTKKVKAKNIEKVKQILHRTYPKAIASFVAKIETLENQSQVFSGMQTVQQKQSIVSLLKERMRLQDQIRKLPDKFLIPQKIPLDDEGVLKEHLVQATMLLDEAKTHQAENDYEEALGLLNQTEVSRVDARQAHQLLSECLNLLPNFRDAQALKLKAKKLATVIIRVLPIKSQLGEDYSLASEMLSQKLNSSLQAVNYTFLKLVYSDEQTGHDMSLQVQIEKVDVYKGSQDITTTFEKKITEGDREIEVKARSIEFRKDLKITIHCDVFLRSADGTLIATIPDIIGYKWWSNTSLKSFNGDKRALSKRVKRLIGKEPSPYPDKKLIMKFAVLSAHDVLVRSIVRQLNAFGQ